MRNLFHSVWRLVTLAVGLAACHRPCPERKRNYLAPVDSAFTAYFAAYGNGSYWVYEDSLTARRDTLFLVDYARNYSDFGEGGCEYGEGIYYRLVSDTTDERAGIRVRANGYGNDTGASVGAATGGSYGSFQIRDGRFVVSLPGLSVREELTVKGTVYRQVVRLESSSLRPGIVFYWARQVGLVRREGGGSVYNLITYHHQ
ncbi:MAG: hypothetical protein H7Z75_10085 [Ferruginibacter sp.]|nr:hypothetical protein [Cytophagales bacterium]